MSGSQPQGRPGDLNSRRDYLLGMMQALWPEPATVNRVGRFSRSRRSDAGPEFIVLRSIDRPTLVLPRRPRRASAAALRNFKSSATGRTRLMLRALSAGVRCGGAELLPDRIRIDANGVEGIDAYLARVLDRQLLVSFYVGPARAVQKPVLQLLTDSGETFGYAKVGVNPLTRALVASEGASLEKLNSVTWEHLSVPELLHLGELRDNNVLVQRALQSSGGGEVSPEVLSAAMVELSQCQGSVGGPLGESVWWTALPARLDQLPASPLTGAVRRAVDRLEPVAAQAPVRIGSWHGDWAPWNMTGAGDRVQVWDWEQFEFGVPVGFDAVHYAVQSAVVMGGSTPTPALEAARIDAARLLAPFGVSAELAPLMIVLYVIELATRYLHDGEVEHGSKFGRLDLWLDEVLDSHLARLDIAVRT